MLTQAHLSFMNVKVAQSCLTFCDPMDCSIPGFCVLRILQARILEWVAIPFSRGSSQPRDQTQVSCTEGDSLPSEPPGKPKNAGVGSLSLLQEISMTQELNWGLRPCIAGRFFTKLQQTTRPKSYINTTHLFEHLHCDRCTFTLICRWVIHGLYP